MLTQLLCEYAWLPSGVQSNVVISLEHGRIASISTPGVGAGVPHGGIKPDRPEWGAPAPTPSTVTRRAGLTVPGFANVHSHAFHRALRGRTHGERGSFWTWREQMYRVAAALDPDRYYALARGVFGEMALAGVTSVGEFHYLHHDTDGKRYANPNEMGLALINAAQDAGIRITLLDTLYLTASVDGRALEGTQLRFSDITLDGWASRFEDLADVVEQRSPDRAPRVARVGAALHSVRAVPEPLMKPFGELAAGFPIHVHLSEQRAENEACQATHGCTPTGLLHRNGLLTEDLTAVHATHLTETDIALLGGSFACFCPTTERDLGDGIGPARALATAGARLNLGSDSHAVIDMIEEARALELNERLATEQRGHFSAAELLDAATGTGHAALGWPDAGRIAPGHRADLVTIALDSPRTSGIQPDGALFAASAADITHVIADGREIVADRRHTSIDVPRELREAISCLF